MKVRDVMATDVGYCQPDAALTQAAEIMWHRDCGIVPVVDEQQKVVGMITDRDICFAVVTRNRLPNEIKISEIMGENKIRSCSPDDDVEDALKIMKRNQVRRLPVVDDEGIIVGILSIADLIRNAGKGKDAVPRKKLLSALKEISHLRPITLHANAPADAESETDDASDDENKESDFAEDDELTGENEAEDADDNDEDEESDDDSGKDDEDDD